MLGTSCCEAVGSPANCVPQASACNDPLLPALTYCKVCGACSTGDNSICTASTDEATNEVASTNAGTSSFFENFPGGQTGATTVGVVALAALAPPPLVMFPPLGVPQPGALSGGGGALPAAALSVSKLELNVYFSKYILSLC